MSTKITVTAILPNYNYAHFLRTRVWEILAQTRPISELIILDDASSDGSQELIKTIVKELRISHPNLKVKTAFNMKNSGNVFAQWQKGIRLATSNLIWICELDDSTAPSFLQSVTKPFEIDKDIILSYSASKIVDASNRPAIKDNLRRVKDLFRRRHVPGSYIVNGKTELNKNLAIFNSIPNVSAVVFKNLPELPQILNQAKTYHLSGDWYFYIELAKLGKIAYIAKTLNSHRVHQTSVTKNTDFEARFQEIKSIHQHVKSTVILSAHTLNRISDLEQDLLRRWHV